jgi:phthiodiolone/phenolphthiodiolone dimycocerosates ketoreductase
MTLADVSGAPVMLQMGAGEAKQCKPFGHKRSQGIRRLEDTFAIFRKFMDSRDPIDHDGGQWTLKDAWLGTARPPIRPQLWALGGGPRLIEAALRYGDGFSTAAPFVVSSPEQARERIGEMKARLAELGRDPEAFGFGLWWICLMHEDAAVIEQAMSNQYIRWISATMGRFNPDEWRSLGIEPPLGEEWHYAAHMLPISIDGARTAEVLAKATPEVVRHSWFHGSPSEMGEQIAPYIDAGINWVQIIDFLPLTRPADEAAEGLGRTLQLAALIKQL